MQNYILENKLAWLNNKLTLEKFEKYLAKDAERKAEVNAKKRAEFDEKIKSKRTEEEDKRIQEAIERGELSAGFMSHFTLTSAERKRLLEVKRQKNVEKIKATANTVKNISKQTFGKIGNWVKKIYKEYNFSPKEEAIMNSASAAIQAVHTNVDPTYYGENAASEISPSNESSKKYHRKWRDWFFNYQVYFIQ